MSTAAHEVQGSKEWLSWRKDKGGASEVAALIGCSPWFPKTPYQLFQVKTGRASVDINPAMQRGLDLEEAARDYLEDRLSEAFEPNIATLGRSGRIIASLDGISFDGITVLEIKIPASGKASETWKHVEQNNAPPENYWWQCQQALMVTGADACIFAVCASEGGEITDAVMCGVEPDKDAHTRIQAAWADFFRYLDTDTPPPLTERDVIERDDAEWRDAAEAYRMAKRSLENAQSAEKLAKERLQELAGEQSTKGYGVTVSRFWVAGSVDYKKAIPADVDIEQYRKQGRWQYRITEAKE